MNSAMKRILVIVWAAGLALACQSQEEATEQGSETSPAIDEAAVREAIATKDKAWADAAVAGDFEAIVQNYTADAVLMPPGAPRAEGTEAIRETLTGWLQEAPPSSMTVTSEVITFAAAGDYAHAVGSWTMSGTGPDGSEYNDQGKFLTVWKSADGDWKIVVDIWNSDNPPAGMASEETAPAE